MKATGIVRKVDELGRIVIPMELRKVFNLEEKDPIEIFIEDERIILKKYMPACMFCGEANGVVSYKGKNICGGCIDKIKKI